MADDDVANIAVQMDKVASALGHLVIAFNDLEVALAGALMYLLKLDEEVGSAFAVHLGARTKIRLLQDLDGRIEDESTRTEFLELVNRAQKINDERNHYIHSEYWPVSDDEQRSTMLHRHLRAANKPVDYPIKLSTLTKQYVKTANEEEIAELANEAESLAMHLLELSQRMFHH